MIHLFSFLDKTDEDSTWIILFCFYLPPSWCWVPPKEPLEDVAICYVFHQFLNCKASLPQGVPILPSGRRGPREEHSDSELAEFGIRKRGTSLSSDCLSLILLVSPTRSPRPPTTAQSPGEGSGLPLWVSLLCLMVRAALKHWLNVLRNQHR